MKRQRAFRPNLWGRLEERVVLAQVLLLQVPLNSTMNGLGAVANGTMITLANAEAEGYQADGAQKLAPGTSLVVSGSASDPTYYLMKAGQTFIQIFREKHPDALLFTAHEVNDGTFAKWRVGASTDSSSNELAVGRHAAVSRAES